jgi:AAA+ ATPase superfamily predicted ATPase
MNFRKIALLAQSGTTVFFLFVFSWLAATEIYLVRRGDVTAYGSLPLLVLVVLGSASLFLGRGERATPIVCLLLASLAVLFSREQPDELGFVLPGLAWEALQYLFGFVFVHFALIFPVDTRSGTRRIRRSIALYAPYAILFALRQFPPSRALAFYLWSISILAGLVLALAVFARKYRVSLTQAEKNRLRVVLIGCLTGALPETFSLLSAGQMPLPLQKLADCLFSLFPLALIFAVLKENFSELGRRMQRVLATALAGAGVVAIFFFFSWISTLIFGEAANSLASMVVASVTSAALSFPLFRWSGSYLSAHFYAAEDPAQEAGFQAPQFAPIQPNPYIAGNPVRSPDMFFGREEDFQFIRTRLQSEQQGCAIILCGERRIGKTSILYQIQNGRLGPDFTPVFLDMQGMVVQKDSEFLEELAARIGAMLPETDLTGQIRPPIQTYLDFNHFMDDVAGRTAGRQLLLLIDEYELIENKVTDGKLSAEIYEYFSSLLLRYPQLSYVFTGSRSLKDSTAWSSLLGKSIYRKISFLGRKDAWNLICAPLRDRVFFVPGMVNEMLRLTNGHAFFTQILCQTMVEVLNERQTNVANIRALAEIVRRVLENPPPQLFYQWKTFSDEEKIVLSALATQLKKAHGYLSPERIEKLVHSLPGDLPATLSATAIHMHFENLRERSFLDRDQTRYRFTMDLMRLWVQSEHNVWKVLSEIASDKPKSEYRQLRH